MDWYAQPLGWPERTAAFIAGGEALFVAAAGRALAQPACPAPTSTPW